MREIATEFVAGFAVVLAQNTAGLWLVLVEAPVHSEAVTSYSGTESGARTYFAGIITGLELSKKS